ncbi:hypothetical protein [Luteimicrobium sp. DT211]|uniref:hypothetical protein n=1 Tax=Luteimicrobium sp. DT211 TaxID=3393412 RepID=UPI003CF31AA1
MTRPLTLDEGRLRMVLPGSWVSVPMEDAARAQAEVRRTVRDRVGRADRLARLRREAVNDVLATVAQAVEVGAHTFLLALELLPGVPFPAAVVGTDAAWPDDVAGLLEEGRVADALASAFPDREIVEMAHGPVARTTDLTRDSVGESSYFTLHLEYLVPDPAGVLLLLRVNVPTIPEVEPFATLFDEIVDSLRWAPGRGRPATPQPDGAAEPQDVAGAAEPRS